MKVELGVVLSFEFCVQDGKQASPDIKHENLAVSHITVRTQNQELNSNQNSENLIRI